MQEGRMMHENVVGRILLDICYNIHSELGPGLFESVYEDILFIELRKAGLMVEKQKLISISWQSVTIERAFRADLLIEDKVIVEIKSVDNLNALHFKQLLSYLKLSDKRLGYLINFNSLRLKEGIHRIINGKLNE